LTKYRINRFFSQEIRIGEEKIGYEMIRDEMRGRYGQPLRGISGAGAPQGNPKLDAKHTAFIL
jgi:hypothetical protein